MTQRFNRTKSRIFGRFCGWALLALTVCLIGTTHPIKATPPLKVAILDNTVATGEEGPITKVALSLWKDFAGNNDIAYTITTRMKNPSSAINLLDLKEADVIIGAMPQTYAEKRSDVALYSQPFFLSHIGIAFHRKSTSMWHGTLLFAEQLIPTLVIILLALGLYVLWFWIIEKEKNSYLAHSHSMKESLDIIAWNAVLLLFNGGVEIIASTTKMARIAVLFWLIFLIIIGTTFISSITAKFSAHENLVHQDIVSLKALHGNTIAVLQDTPSVALANKYGTAILYNDIAALLKNVNVGNEPFGFGEYYTLQYNLRHAQEDHMVGLSKILLTPIEYVFALGAHHEKLQKSLNTYLGDTQKNGSAKRMCYRFLGTQMPCDL